MNDIKKVDLTSIQKELMDKTTYINILPVIISMIFIVNILIEKLVNKINIKIDEIIFLFTKYSVKYKLLTIIIHKIFDNNISYLLFIFVDKWFKCCFLFDIILVAYKFLILYSYSKIIYFTKKIYSKILKSLKYKIGTIYLYIKRKSWEADNIIDDKCFICFGDLNLNINTGVPLNIFTSNCRHTICKECFPDFIERIWNTDTPCKCPICNENFRLPKLKFDTICIYCIITGQLTVSNCVHTLYSCNIYNSPTKYCNFCYKAGAPKSVYKSHKPLKCKNFLPIKKILQKNRENQYNSGIINFIINRMN